MWPRPEWCTLALLLSVALLLAPGPARAQLEPPELSHRLTPLASPVVAENFVLEDMDGKRHALEDYRGKVVLINFWATWCPPCRREIPLLVDIQREFAARNVQVIGIAIDETEAVTEFAARIPFNFPVLVGQQEAVDLANAYLPDFIGLPFTAFADRDGRLVHVHTGELHREQIEAILGSLL